MRYQTQLIDNFIRGSCPLFVCRCCRTKYGWRHQGWCEIGSVTEPTCLDCRYFHQTNSECVHPSQKREGRDLPYEEDQDTI